MTLRRPSAQTPRPAAALRLTLLAVAMGTFLIASTGRAQEPVQGRILDQDLAQGQGISVLHVWGSHYDMGYAHGYLLADWIELAGTEMKTTFSAYWPSIRGRVSGWTFLPVEAEEEFQGILDGLRALHPSTTLDLLDLKACCTFGDWSYSFACRSTACWGGYVEPPYTTLSARKLQFYTLPSGITQQWHHVICAWEPDDGTPAWVNFGFPGYASSVTAVNEYGTVASLHDWNSSSGTNWANALPRTMACRWVLTMDLGSDPMTHLQTAFASLQPFRAATGGFLNYYVPEGGAGVIKTSKNQGFYAVRLPMPEYMNGQSISTNNSDISGAFGIEPWDAYYQTLDPGVGIRATMEGLWATAWQSTDMHIVEIGFRERGDMTIWFTGRLQSSNLDKVIWEWSDLFRDPATADERPDAERSQIRRHPFPNPAGHAEVTMAFEAPSIDLGKIPTLEIFDSSGRRVRALSRCARGEEPGVVVFRWDGRDDHGRQVAAGVYSCRVLGSDEPARVIWIER